MIKHLIPLCFLFSTFSALAASSYYPQDFETKIHTQTDTQLKSTLFEVLNSFHIKQDNAPDTLAQSCTSKETNCYRHIMLSYKQARQLMFGKIDLEEDTQGYFIKDVYCDRDMRTSDIGPNQIPGTQVVNCEHTWPQSRFSNAFPRDLQKGDLHHLYSTNAKANSTRGNYPFAEVTGGDQPAPNCNASMIGGSKENANGIYFEHPAEHKGNVARALFYFSIRYQLPIDKAQEDYLRQWHKEDPVTAADRKRNDAIYAEQKNRNPFIDFPELVDHISDF